jgi:ribosome-associated heat shock protein Hsp15
MAADLPHPEGIRLDKWLWQARFCKSRAIAQRLIEAGKVRVNAARVTKPSATVRVGDGISFAYASRVHAVRVAALGDRRGPASEAQALYVDLDAVQQASALEPAREADT